MFEQHPRRMRKTVGLYATQLDRHVFYRVIKTCVGSTTVQQFDQLLPQLVVVDCEDDGLAFLLGMNLVLS